MRMLFLLLALIPALTLGGGPAPAAAEGGDRGGAGSGARTVADVVRDGAWSWPVEGVRQVIRPFIAPAERWSAGHRGVDLAAGELLLAPANGVVSFAGEVVDRGVLSIDHGAGVVSSYEPVTPLVAVGDVVEPGEPIAIVDPGHCAVRCVHMGVRVDGEYANPLRWLGGVARSVLLPTRPLD